jgi:hypothetical protein
VPEVVTVERATLRAAVASILVDNGVRGQEKIDRELDEFERCLAALRDEQAGGS